MVRLRASVSESEIIFAVSYPDMTRIVSPRVAQNIKVLLCTDHLVAQRWDWRCVERVPSYACELVREYRFCGKE